MSANALLALMGEESKVKTTTDDNEDGIGCYDLTKGAEALIKVDEDTFVINTPKYPEMLCIDSYNTSISDSGFYAVGNGRPVSYYNGLKNMTNASLIGSVCQYADNGDVVAGHPRIGLSRLVPFTTSYDRRITHFVGAVSQGFIALTEDGTVYAHPKVYPLDIAANYFNVSVNTKPTSLVEGVAKFPVAKKVYCNYNYYFSSDTAGYQIKGTCLYLLSEDNTLYALGYSNAFNLTNQLELKAVLTHVKDFVVLGTEGYMIVLRTYGDMEYYGYPKSNYLLNYYGKSSVGSYEGNGRNICTSITDVYGNNLIPDDSVTPTVEGWLRGVVLCKGVKELCHVSSAEASTGLVSTVGDCMPFGCITTKKELVVFGNQGLMFNDFFGESHSDDRFGQGAKIVATDVDKAWYLSGTLFYNSKGKSYVMGVNFSGCITGSGGISSESVTQDYYLTSDFNTKLYHKPLYTQEPILYSNCEIHQVYDYRTDYYYDFPSWFFNGYRAPCLFVALKDGSSTRLESDSTNYKYYEPFNGEIKTVS
jgi:hypothetical protein